MTRNEWIGLLLLLFASSIAGIVIALVLPALTIPIGWLVTITGILLALAIAFSRALQRARSRAIELGREIETRDLESKSLWQAGLDVADAEDYGQLLRAIVDRARDLIGGEASALCLWDEQKNWWVLQGTSGTSDAFEVSVNRIPGRDKQTPIECPVIRFKFRQAHLDVPVMHGDQVVGCLCVANQSPRDFSVRERELVAGLAAQAARAINQARRLENESNRAATHERELMAREMHDTVAQLLGFVGFKTQAVRELVAGGKISEAQTQLDQLAALAQELYADTREIILGLRTETSPGRSLVAALEDYVTRFSGFCNLPTTLDTSRFDSIRLTPTMEVQLIRVVQEALSNIRKHAQARHANIVLERADEFALVKIQDDGRGFDTAHIRHGVFPQFGLQSMRERVQTIGGTFAIDSAPDRGTTITIKIPLVQRGAQN